MQNSQGELKQLKKLFEENEREKRTVNLESAEADKHVRNITYTHSVLICRNNSLLTQST